MESPHNNFILSISILLIFKALLFLKLAHMLNPDHSKFRIFKDILWFKTKYEGRQGTHSTHSPCRRKNMSSRESPKLWSRIIWKLKSHPQCDSRWCLLQTQVTISSRFFSKSFESPVVKVATISWFSACYIERENSFIVYSTNIHTFLDRPNHTLFSPYYIGFYIQKENYTWVI